eukprot:TRINITY_DN4520_c0_g1_i1.p1 TRINITY_DN4520_c0_g1~~TRINITY_DN4520_c0_g1_i1.p1  ORF type:complete len:1030 (-),score=134.80 TRINITY_DN4520_c0_g1_i1:236-3325(-)
MSIQRDTPFRVVLDAALPGSSSNRLTANMLAKRSVSTVGDALELSRGSLMSLLENVGLSYADCLHVRTYLLHLKGSSPSFSAPVTPIDETPHMNFSSYTPRTTRTQDSYPNFYQRNGFAPSHSLDDIQWSHDNYDYEGSYTVRRASSAVDEFPRSNGQHSNTYGNSQPLSYQQQRLQQQNYPAYNYSSPREPLSVPPSRNGKSEPDGSTSARRHTRGQQAADRGDRALFVRIPEAEAVPTHTPSFAYSTVGYMEAVPSYSEPVSRVEPQAPTVQPPPSQYLTPYYGQSTEASTQLMGPVGPSPPSPNGEVHFVHSPHFYEVSAETVQMSDCVFTPGEESSDESSADYDDGACLFGSPPVQAHWEDVAEKANEVTTTVYEDTPQADKRPSVYNVYLKGCWVDGEVTAVYEYKAGSRQSSEGATTFQWFASRDGREWMPRRGRGGTYLCGIEDLHHHIKCVVTPISANGNAGASVEASALCGLSSLLQAQLYEALRVPHVMFNVEVEGRDGQLKLKQSGVSLYVNGKQIQKLKWATKQGRFASAYYNRDSPDNELILELKPKQPTTIRVKQPNAATLRSAILLVFRLMYAMNTDSIAREFLSLQIVSDWRAGKLGKRKKPPKEDCKYYLRLRNEFVRQSLPFPHALWRGPVYLPLGKREADLLQQELVESGVMWVACRDALLAVFAYDPANERPAMRCERTGERPRWEIEEEDFTRSPSNEFDASPISSVATGSPTSAPTPRSGKLQKEVFRFLPAAFTGTKTVRGAAVCVNHVIIGCANRPSPDSVEGMCDSCLRALREREKGPVSGAKSDQPATPTPTRAEVDALIQASGLPALPSLGASQRKREQAMQRELGVKANAKDFFSVFSQPMIRVKRIRVGGSLSRENAIRVGRQLLTWRLNQLQFSEVVMLEDGNCQFRAFSHQLYQTSQYHPQLRAMAVKHIEDNLNDFLPYFDGERDLRSYLRDMSRNGTWGDEITLRAVSDCLRVAIHVILSTEGNWYLKYEPTPAEPNARNLFLAYLSPVHYNSVTG